MKIHSILPPYPLLFHISMALILCVWGCTPRHASNNAPKRLVSEIPSPVPLPPSSSPESSLEEARHYANLRLADALALALRGNPALQSYSYESRIKEAQALQAGLLPNPELSVTVEDVLGSGDYRDGRQAQSTLLLSQLVELGGKRGARKNLAGAFLTQSEDEYERKKMEVLSLVTEHFLKTASEEKLFQLAQKAERLARESLSSIQQRVSAGATSTLEESKALVLHARAKITLEHAGHELATCKRELASLWGSSEVHFSTLQAELFSTPPLPSLSSLEEKIEKSPEILRWANEERIRKAEEELAHAKKIPNLSLGFGPRRLEGEDAHSWVFQVSMPLSIFDRNQGGREEARLRREQTGREYTSRDLRLKTSLFGLYQELQHALTQKQVMQKKIVPEAERSLRIAQKGYAEGRLSYLDLYDAQRVLLEVHREHIESAYLYHHYRNAIEALLGISIKNIQKKKD